MMRYIPVLLLLWLTLGGASAHMVTVVTEIEVIEDMNLACMELTIKNIPMKEDFFKSDYSLNVTYFDSKRSLKRAITMNMDSTDGICNAMVRYNATMNAHITHVCGRLTSPFIDYYGISGVLSMKNLNHKYGFKLKKNSYIARDLPKARIHRRQHTNYLDSCGSADCKSCSRTCTALHHDVNKVICDKRLVELYQDHKMMEPLSVVDFSRSQVSCIYFRTNLISSCELFPVGLIETVKYYNGLCRVAISESGTGYWCLNVDSQKLKDMPISPVKVYAKCEGAYTSRKITTSMDLRSLQFSIESRVLRNHSSGVSCSVLVNNSKANFFTEKKKKKSLKSNP